VAEERKQLHIHSEAHVCSNDKVEWGSGYPKHVFDDGSNSRGS